MGGLGDSQFTFVAHSDAPASSSLLGAGFNTQIAGMDIAAEAGIGGGLDSSGNVAFSPQNGAIGGNTGLGGLAGMQAGTSGGAPGGLTNNIAPNAGPPVGADSAGSSLASAGAQSTNIGGTFGTGLLGNTF